MRDRQFRADLFFRLNVVRLHLSPLRERLSDIPLLARHFVSCCAAEAGLGAKVLSPSVLPKLLAARLARQRRELGSSPAARRRARARAPHPSEHVILPLWMRQRTPSAAADNPSDSTVSFRKGRAQVIEAFERSYVARLIEKHAGNVTRAARGRRRIDARSGACLQARPSRRIRHRSNARLEAFALRRSAEPSRSVRLALKPSRSVRRLRWVDCDPPPRLRASHPSLPVESRLPRRSSADQIVPPSSPTQSPKSASQLKAGQPHCRLPSERGVDPAQSSPGVRQVAAPERRDGDAPGSELLRSKPAGRGQSRRRGALAPAGRSRHPPAGQRRARRAAVARRARCAAPDDGSGLQPVFSLDPDRIEDAQRLLAELTAAARPGAPHEER